MADEQEPVDETPEVDAAVALVDNDPSSENLDTTNEQVDTSTPETTQETQAERAQSLRDLLQARGIPVQGDDDESVLSNLAAYTQQLTGLAQYGYQARPHWEKFQQYLNSQQQAAQPQVQQPTQQQVAAAKEAKRRFEKLEYDPSWDSLVTRDAEGNLVPKSQYVDPTVPQKLNAYQSALRDRLAQFGTDPEGFVRETMGDYVSQTIEQAIEQRLASERQRQQEQTFAAQTIASNQQLFFAADAKGSPLTDPQTGQRLLTAEGHAYANAVAQAHAAGITDTFFQHQIGMGAVAQVRMANPTAQPTQPAVDQRKQFLNKINPATRTPNRNGSVRTTERSDFAQNPSAMWEQLLDQAAQEAGIR